MVNQLINCIKKMVFSAAKDAKEFSSLTKSLKEYLNFPTAITTDSRGTIYAVDHGARIVILGAYGFFLGRKPAVGWNKGRFYYPSQICGSDKGFTFIVNRGNSSVQMVTPIEQEMIGH